MIISAALRPVRRAVNKFSISRVASFSSSPFSHGDRRDAPPPNKKVCILGANGTIGKQIAYILKLHPCISRLALYDDSSASIRLASLISQLSTRAKAVGYWSEDEQGLGHALSGSDVVVVTAGVPNPETSSDNLYKTKAEFLRSLCTAIAEHCPQAGIHMVSNPICSLKIAKEVFEKARTYKRTRLVGVFSDHVGIQLGVPRISPPGNNSQKKDIWAVKEGRKHEGIEMFQGTPEDALAITYASIVRVDSYLSSLNESGSGFTFLDSAYTDQIK